jgi:hypothetical protein
MVGGVGNLHSDGYQPTIQAGSLYGLSNAAIASSARVSVVTAGFCESLPGATARRQAEPGLPLHPGVPPAARGLRAGLRAAGPSRTAKAPDPRRPRLRPTICDCSTEGLVRSGKLAYGSAVSYGY